MYIGKMANISKYNLLKINLTIAFRVKDNIAKTKFPEKNHYFKLKKISWVYH